MTLGNYLRIAARVIGPPADAAMPMQATLHAYRSTPPEHSTKTATDL